MTNKKQPGTGYSAADRAQPWAKFYDDRIAPLPEHVVAALEKGALPPGSLPPPEDVSKLLEKSHAPTETGYALEADGSIRVAVLTPMPGVSPAMWDWWFGWHGSRTDRYKLWHPLAHVDARWADGLGDTGGYVGRTSLIAEYIGGKLEKGAIQFVSPEKMGLAPTDFSDKNKVAFICARIGHASLPVDFGWLVHQIRATEDGAEMRSRFWLGGRHVAGRGGSWLGGLAGRILRVFIKLPERQARDLLVHCAEEMKHLAAFLPAVHAEFG